MRQLTSHCYFIADGWGEHPVAQQFRSLAEALVKRGHKVVFLVDGKRKEIESHETNPAIYTWPSKRPTHFRDAYFLHKLITRFKPDCLIANFGSVNIMMLVGLLSRIPHRIAWFHTMTSATDIDMKVSKWKMKLLRFRKRFIYKIATGLVAVSNAALYDICGTYGIKKAKCRVCYNAISDPHKIIEINLNKNYNKMVCVGRLDFSKGQDIVIKALALLKNSFPDLTVDFIGAGLMQAHFKDNLLELIERYELINNCSFVGQVSHKDVLKRMASSYVTIVPSRSEAFGLVNIESMAVGTPVVASNVGGIPEIIRDGVDGFLVPPGDPEVLAEKIKIILTDHSLREKMGNNARQNFLKNFELNKSVMGQIKWFEALLNSYDSKRTSN
ncbi:MAG: glycosyltransferase family 4 protein [Thermodesulfobacteriota bacterium]